ncbi:MAG: FAD-dependent oxidoreductase [Deferribacteres bacterium]|nr:FAD-dependent oxidoreductase [Deferribacteres bacterium]
MKKPIIFAIDDDPQVLNAIARDIRNAYRKEYRIIHTESPNQALATLRELKQKNETVAMFVTDQRMPEMLGVDFLERAKALYPEAKRILLTAYSDIEAAIKAINTVQLDYYLMKPWDPPEEKLYPVLSDQLDTWQAGYRPEFEGLKLIGFQWSPKSHLLKDFLAGNLIPYQWLDIETDSKAAELQKLHRISNDALPAVVFEDGAFALNPTPVAIAEKIGLKSIASEKMYDVVIVGAGPAGLAAAVYGASEGLKTLLIEKRAPGGQAGTSSRIENYLGFPSGLSGAELTHRAVAQARRLGAEIVSPQEVVNIDLQANYKRLALSDGSEINSRSIVIATGVNYRQLEAKGIDDYTGAGIYYGAATTEAKACLNQDVYVVGGGNSAGQAAMYLSNFARQVNIVIRRPDLSATMSQYLIEQISQTSNIAIIGNATVVEASGNGQLEEIVLENIQTGEQQHVPAAALYIFIGARPFTDWVKLDIIKDARGFIETGSDLQRHADFRKIWKLEREPFLLETCCPGIFAAGDVRAGAMNRIASAVGEGAMSIKFVHEYLAGV